MLAQSNNLIGKQIIGEQEGKIVATIIQTIIDPNNLNIAGFYCSGPWSQKKSMVLLSQDIKTMENGRVVINSVNEISDLEDLVRLQEIVKINYKLLGKTVRTESKKKLGKVGDYAINLQNFEIQKIKVTLSFFRSLNTHNLLVDREQIIEVNDHEVIVADTVLKNPAPVPQQVT